MTLQLPRMSSLPNEGRMYFFYVSHCHLNDTLGFTPLPATGDTVNGNLGTFNFTLSGLKQLYVCIGVNGNWIIHPFVSGPDNDQLPTEAFSYNIEQPGIFGPAISSPYPGAGDIFAGAGAVGPGEAIVPGMETFLTPDTPVPTQAFNGFLCNQSGIYLINPDLQCDFTYTAAALTGSNLGPLHANWLSFNSDGTFNEDVRTSAYAPFVPEVNPTSETLHWFHNTSFFAPMTQGKYYLPSFSWDNSSIGTNGTAHINGTAVFVYWAPNPPGPGPMDLSIPSPSPSSSSLMSRSSDLAGGYVAMGSKQDIPRARLAASQSLAVRASSAIRERERQVLGAAGVSGGGGGGPSLSLADVESIVRGVLRAQQQASVSITPPAPVVLSSSSSSSSSSSAPTRKRARQSEKE